MKKLFLASCVCNVLDRFVEMLDKTPADLTVAFIPTAADVYEDKFFVELDRKAFVDFGFKLLEVNVAGQTESFLMEKLRGVDIVFVAGGNTFYLLEKVLESGFDKVLRQMIAEGKYYIGSSAGSILAGSTIRFANDDLSRAPGLKSFKGLGLIDKIIFPHYGKIKYKDKQDQALAKDADLRDCIIKLTDNQAVLVEGENYRIVSVEK